MTKRIMILSICIAALLSVSHVAIAVEFGPNSARITNRYFPATVGGWGYMLGAGDFLDSARYSNIVGIEEVSGARIGAQTFNNVKCLRVDIITAGLNEDDEFVSVWVAQDTLGNLWILKGYSHFGNKTFMLGTDFTSMFIPADPQVNDSTGIIVPEIPGENYCRVDETNVSKDTNFGSYDSCIKSICYYASSIHSVEYYCPDVGEVRSTGSSEQEIMDLKEYGSATVNRVVVVPMMD